MDYTEILSCLCNLTQEFELTRFRLWTVPIQKALKREKMPSFKFYTLIAYFQAL